MCVCVVFSVTITSTLQQQCSLGFTEVPNLNVCSKHISQYVRMDECNNRREGYQPASKALGQHTH